MTSGASPSLSSITRGAVLDKNVEIKHNNDQDHWHLMILKITFYNLGRGKVFVNVV